MSIGFRIYLNNSEGLDKEIIEALRDLPASNISDCMGRLSGMNSEIKRISRNGIKMVGQALTVKARSGDNLMLHKAIDLAQEGEIIVVSNGGDRSRALMGEVMVRHAEFRKVGGFVLDGPIRDIDTLRELEIPIYATGSTPAGPYKEGPGEINVSISCGGVSINPGDIIVGDDDGVIVIPLGDVKDVLELAKKFKENDQNKIRAAMNGTADRSWVDKSLAEKNCEYIDLNEQVLAQEMI